MTWREFLSWERTSRDTIDLKKIYCDLAGDLVAGVVLSQILFWRLPGKKGQDSKLRIKKDGYLWLAKNHGDWWDECRVSAKQAAHALKRLSEQKLVVTKNSMFAGRKCPLIRVNEAVFLSKLKECSERQDAELLDPDEIRESISTKRRNRFYPKGEIGHDQTSKPSYREYLRDSGGEAPRTTASPHRGVQAAASSTPEGTPASLHLSEPDQPSSSDNQDLHGGLGDVAPAREGEAV